MSFLGLLGIILMIVENELTFNRIDHKDTTFSLLLKATITFTTIILVGLVFYYHRIDLSLYCVDNSIDDWRIALTRRKIFLILFEAFICMIHPIPGHFLVEWSSQYAKKAGSSLNPYRSTQNSLNSTTTTSTSTIKSDINDQAQAYVPIDVMLSLPSKVFFFFIFFFSIIICFLLVFFRLYLLCRFIMLHSHLVRDASSQSLGYLNRVSFNFPFIIKSYIKQRPAICLTTFCITTFFIASWSLRACDYNVKTGHMAMSDATWLFIISFTTIGNESLIRFLIINFLFIQDTEILFHQHIVGEVK